MAKQRHLKAVDNTQQHESVESLTEELTNKLTKKDFEDMISEVQKQDSLIERARKNKQAAYAKLSNKGASTKGLQIIVAKQQKPPADQALVDATLRAFMEVTGQSDIFFAGVDTRNEEDENEDTD